MHVLPLHAFPQKKVTMAALSVDAWQFLKRPCGRFSLSGEQFQQYSRDISAKAANVANEPQRRPPRLNTHTRACFCVLSGHGRS